MGAELDSVEAERAREQVGGSGFGIILQDIQSMCCFLLKCLSFTSVAIIICHGRGPSLCFVNILGCSSN